MIRIGDISLTLFVGETSIKEAYLGDTRIYPDREAVITVEYSEWATVSLTLSTNVTEIPAAGGSAVLSAIAHQMRTKTTLADGVPIATEQETRDTAVTPSLSSNHGAFSVSGATVSCGSRGTTAGGQLVATIRGTYGGTSGTITLYQQENKAESYEYRVATVSSGSAIAWNGGNTTVSAKSQRTTTFTSGTTSDYEDTTAQTISARISGTGFSISIEGNSGSTCFFRVSASSHSSTSPRTATVTFTGSIGGVASTTVRQAGMLLTYGFRYTASNKASKYPRFAVNGVPGGGLLRAVGGIGTPIHMQSYRGAITKVLGSTTSYLDGEPEMMVLGPESAYIGSGYISGWSDSTYALGFISGQQGNFMNNYPYKYVTQSFTVKGSGFSLSGIALFEKNYGDYEAAGYKWYVEADTSSPYALSAAEARAAQQLAENGVVTTEDDSELAEVDFEALAAKINALREPDTDTYVQNEDGTWTTVPKESLNEKEENTER